MARVTTKVVGEKPKRSYVRKAVKATPQETASKAVSTALAQVARVVMVRFAGNQNTYSYHTYDETIAVGDFCIVISPLREQYTNDRRFFINALNGSPSIVEVVDVKETAHSIHKATKWIAQKLDLKAAIEAAQRDEQIEVLMAKISKARKAAEERVKLEQLRELSPELDSLITQLDQLQQN